MSTKISGSQKSCLVNINRTSSLNDLMSKSLVKRNSLVLLEYTHVIGEASRNSPLKASRIPSLSSASLTWAALIMDPMVPMVQFHLVKV